MTEIEKLEKTLEIADARLEIAEIFAWPVAGFSAATVWLIFNSWLFAVGVFAIVFFVSSYGLRKESTAAEDAHMKATKTGRYYEDQSKVDNQI